MPNRCQRAACGVAWYLETIANPETSFVGQGIHFIREDQPEGIGRAIAGWLRRH